MDLLLGLTVFCLFFDSQSNLNGGDSTQKQAIALGVSPAQEPLSEQQRKQVTNLFEASLARSPDIDFVLQKLQFTSASEKHEWLLKVLEMSLNPSLHQHDMAIADPDFGDESYTKIKSISHDKTYLPLSEKARPRRKARASKLTKTEQIVLSNMIRTFVDKVVNGYRGYEPLYRKSGSGLKESEIHLLMRYRQDLIDVSGAEAVLKLEGELNAAIKSSRAGDDSETDNAKKSTRPTTTKLGAFLQTGNLDRRRERARLIKLCQACVIHSSDLAKIREKFAIRPEALDSLIDAEISNSGALSGFTITRCGMSPFAWLNTNTVKRKQPLPSQTERSQLSQVECMQIYNQVRQTIEKLMSYYQSYDYARLTNRDPHASTADYFSFENHRKNLEAMVGESALKEFDETSN